MIDSYPVILIQSLIFSNSAASQNFHLNTKKCNLFMQEKNRLCLSLSQIQGLNMNENII